MNFIINKITYILERAWLIVISLVLILLAQVINLTEEIKTLKNEINPTYSSQEVRLPSANIVPIIPSNNQISIPQSQE